MSAILKKNNVTVTGNTGAAKTIIFAHGFGTDQTSWQQVSQPFLSDHWVILYDNVGGGKAEPSAYSSNKYDTLHTYAGDLLDICAELDVKDAVMVSHSVSSMISLLASIENPAYFSKYVFIGASPRYLNDGDYIGGFEQADLDGLFDAMNNNYFAWVSGFSGAAMANPDRPQLAEYFASTLKAIRADIAQAVARVIFQSDHRKDLAKFSGETLLIQTKEDIAVPMAVATYLNAQITGSKLVVADAYGHFPHISAPSEIINAIQNFL